MAACAVGREAGLALMVHDGFSHNGAGRIACAQEQYVIAPLHERPLSQLQQVGAQHDWFPSGFTARTKALMNLPSTWGAIASTSMFCPERNSRASSMR